MSIISVRREWVFRSEGRLELLVKQVFGMSGKPKGSWFIEISSQRFPLESAKDIDDLSVELKAALKEVQEATHEGH